MGEFVDVVRRRRMTRAFDTRPVPDQTIAEMVDLASRAPSAGKAQGWHLVVLRGDETARFWDITLPVMRRGAFKWQRLLDAPLIALPFADPKAYTDRYSEPDKAATGLGVGEKAWPAPYWTIDASMAVMTMLLAAEDNGLGALFFGVFKGERELRQELGVPSGLELLGALAIGYRADPTDPVAVPAPDAGKGRSAGRSRRAPTEIIHTGRW
jgi:nitroreductase